MWNTSSATAVISTTSISPTTANGSVFPSISSIGRRGVTISCSMVPISFSRTIASAVSIRVTINDDVGHHARDEIIAAVQIGIEPHARARRHLRKRHVDRRARDFASEF